MSKLHHLTLKAAVAKYGPLFRDGKPEADIREAIEADEKEFDEDQVDEIYAAIAGPDFKSDSYVVVNPFRDIANFDKRHQPGDDVSHFDPERLSRLVKLGLVEKQ